LNADLNILPAEAARMIEALTAVVAHASAAIQAASPDTVVRRTKPDSSPVTAADEASEAIILRELARLMPNIPVISEEMAGREAPPALAHSFIVVDPLDGTREFLAGTDQFTVNLAIVTQGVPIAGIIAAPRRGQLWRGVVGGQAAGRRRQPTAHRHPALAGARCGGRRQPLAF
jgi:3'(2'), 5'-bisphosphate nucleotidase